MKKLTKILLINWLYYSKQLIEPGDISFLTGKNSTGKSTIIDALQIVLLGELNERNFNKAASKESQRTLNGYLRADMDTNNPKSRRGKDFSSYIACQYMDDVKGLQFVAGIVFDCRNDGTRREQFFIYNGVIPENCFIVDKEAMDISALRSYIKGLPNADGVFYDSNARYRNDLLAKWNVHNEQVCRMLKKAVSFQPITDIQKFITENICDIPEKPDIVSMQQNIRDYKHHEQLAQRQEQKLGALIEIGKLFQNLQSAQAKLRIHNFLQLWAQKNNFETRIEKLKDEITACLENIRKEQERYDSLEAKIQECVQQERKLRDDRANSDVCKKQKELDTQKVQLQREHTRLEAALDKTVLEIKREAQVLLHFSEDITSLPNIELLQSLSASAAELIGLCQPLLSCTSEVFAENLAQFIALQEKSNTFSASLRQTAFQADAQLNQINNELNNNNEILINLQSNVKDYPGQLLAAKAKIEEQLSLKHKQPVSVEILADLLEIDEKYEQWRGALEGFLNMQKFYFLIAPEFYEDALAMLDELKQEYEYQAVGIVDINKLKEKENFAISENSLAEIVQTDNMVARNYIDYLLGDVICCSKLEQLRENQTSIMPEGIVYQGYVAKTISNDDMDNAFIGHKAIELRIKRLQDSIVELKKEKSVLSPIHNKLNTQKDREFLFTERFIQEMEQRQNEYTRTLEIAREIKTVDEELSKLDLLWLNRLDEQIEGIGHQLEKLRGEEKESIKEKTKLEEQKRRIENEQLPENQRLLSDTEERLNKEFSEDYKENVGLPRYAQELERLKRPDIIARNYGVERLGQTKSELDKAKDTLFDARRNYVNNFQPCSFRPDVMDNDEFENERVILEESELPLYREKIKKARESALEQFQNDFLSKLKASIDQVQSQVKNLNRALENASFGTDKYKFIVTRNPDEADYYDMIMAPELMEGDEGLFAVPFQQKYGDIIENLFSRIAASDDVALNARKQSELQQNIERYTDFRTYLKFDLETTDLNGSKQLLSQTMHTKSGGETQTPFYIAVLASFAQLYRVNDTSDFGNTVRLVVFDEAFNKMDSDRIIESVRLLRKMKLQAIICTPPDKLPDIMPEADCTLLTCKEKYTMLVLPYTKELVDTWNEN